MFWEFYKKPRNGEVYNTGWKIFKLFYFRGIKIVETRLKLRLKKSN